MYIASQPYFIDQILMDGTTQSMRHHMVVNSQLETATQAGQIFPLPLESLFYHVSTGTVYMYTSPA